MKPCCCRHSTRRGAFTLIELLVVIAIMGMLMSILLPSLKKARESAKETDCLVHLHGLYLAHATYLHDNDRFPALNNEDDEGAWQFNYLIYDGRDFDSGFGPLLADGRTLDDMMSLYCPVQEDPYHSPSTAENPWPIVPTRDTRSGYARRYHLSGLALSQIPRTVAILSDVIHLPKVVRSAHKDGVNAAYSDGHARRVRNRKLFADNELAHPFQRMDNDFVKKLWHAMDDAK